LNKSFGIPLLPHGQRRELRVPQIQLRVRVMDAVGQVLLVPPVGQHLAAALAHHDRGTGVLAHGQHAAGRDAGVLEQVTRDELVVAAGLGVIQDGAQLAQVTGPQQVGDVPHRLPREHREHARPHLKEFPAERQPPPDPVLRQEPVLRGIGAQRQQVGVGELGHDDTSSWAG